MLLGVIAIIWAALPSSAVIAGNHIGLPDGSWWRYVLGALGLVLAGFGMVIAAVSVGLINSRTEKSEAGVQRLPIQNIKINKSATTGGPNPKVRVSGDVTPPKAGVNVWLLRENRAGGAAGIFGLAKGYATTDDNGHWEHTANLYWPGPFRIYAVVTTEEYEDLFHFYRRVWDAMLKVQQNPNTYSVLGWPSLGALPKIRKEAWDDVTITSTSSAPS